MKQNHPLNPPLRRRGGNLNNISKPLFFEEGFGVIENKKRGKIL
jgi:hypothetical protein